MVSLTKILLFFLALAIIHETGYWFNKINKEGLKSRFDINSFGLGLMLWSFFMLFIIIITI